MLFKCLLNAGGGRSALSAGRSEPGEAATAPFSQEVTTTTLGSRRSEPVYYSCIQHNRPKRRPDAASPDAYGRCLSCLLGVRPRLGASRAASGASSGGGGPRWGGKETEHGVQVEQSMGRSSARGALTPCLALESSWRAQTRVFGPSRGVSPVLSRRYSTKTLALTAPQMLWSDH